MGRGKDPGEIVTDFFRPFTKLQICEQAKQAGRMVCFQVIPDERRKGGFVNSHPHPTGLRARRAWWPSAASCAFVAAGLDILSFGLSQYLVQRPTAPPGLTYMGFMIAFMIAVAVIGINSIDARGVVQMPNEPRLATTDFYQVGTSSTWRRLSLSTDFFLIAHSNEQVYIPDDGSFEFKGPSRAYGYEAKASLDLTHDLSLSGGLTKIANVFFKGGDHRVYVDSAPHFVANAALTMTGWHEWSGSLRMRAINHYRLDGDDPSIVASGHTVFDFGLARKLSRRVELNLSLDNLTNRDYYETQNYFESRVTPDTAIIARIHATPAYPLTAVAGLTLRFGGK
jgi:hypothetical protein